VRDAPDEYREPDGPASQQGMRRANLALVLGTVARLGTASRAQLSDSTGLTRAAVGSLAGELIDACLVRERGVSLADAGRALGITLAGAVNLVDPEKVVLGGAHAELAPWLTPGDPSSLRA
jgi:hypothetical protein